MSSPLSDLDGGNQEEIVNGDRGSRWWIAVKHLGPIAVVSFKTARLTDDYAIEKTGEELDQLIQVQPAPRLLLDLSTVQTMASSMLARLIRLHQAVKDAHGRLALCGLRPGIAALLEVSKLNRVFAICSNQHEAMVRLTDNGSS